MDWMDQIEDLSRPKVEKRQWMNDVHMELITSKSGLKRVVAECIKSGLYAFDIETTGLDNRVFPGPEEGRTVDRIVGYCLSPDGEKGYYIPVRHQDKHGELIDTNLNFRVAAKQLRRLADSEARAIFHNGKFDHEFLEFGEDDGPIGKWDDPEHWEDTLILAYLRNSRERRKGLKHLANQDLGLDMIELTDLFTAEQKKEMKGSLNFSLLDPSWEPCIWYACSDAICTYRLYQLLWPGIESPEPTGSSQRVIYQLEKMCVPATRWMERCRVYIDRDKVRELIGLGQEEWFDSLEEVYADASKIMGRDIRPGWYRVMRGSEDVPAKAEFAFDPAEMSPTYMECREEAMSVSKQHGLDPMEVNASGKNVVRRVRKEVPSLTTKKREMVAFPVVYDVTIAAELGLLLRELGVRGLQTTEKSGQIKTSKDVLDRVIEDAGDQFPFMKKVKRFREVMKALGTNLFPIWHDTDPSRTPDGTIRIGFNGHKVDTGRFSTPQPRGKDWHGQVRWNIHSIPATYDKNKPACMLRIREAVKARPGRVLFAIDYAGVELRIVTNLSREPLWITEFFRCNGCGFTFDRGNGRETPPAPPPFCPKCGSDKIGDLHSMTCQAVFGEVSKDKRQKSKGLNFAMCYGGGALAAQRAVGVDKDEGWRLKRQFDGTYKGLRAWWATQHNFARKYKFVPTAFGRRYQLPDIDHEMGGFRSKAERNAVNGPVQGTSADIIKLAMAYLYREFQRRGWLTKVLMTITIHDELVFEIDEDIVEEAIEVIDPIMTVKTVHRLKQPIPLRVDKEFGDDWTVPYDLTKLAHNKGGGKWTPRLVGMFPKAYTTYLEAGGEPVDGAETPPTPPPPVESPPEGGSEPPPAAFEITQQEAPAMSRQSFQMPETEGGKPFRHVIPATKLSYGLMERVAQLLVKCEGRGTQPLMLVTEDGESLWEGPEILVSAAQFKVLAEEYDV